MAHGQLCSMARGIFPDQGLNPCLLHWQAESLPLSHQGSQRDQIFIVAACGISPDQGLNRGPTTLEAWSLSAWITRGVPLAATLGFPPLTPVSCCLSSSSSIFDMISFMAEKPKKDSVRPYGEHLPSWVLASLTEGSEHFESSTQATVAEGQLDLLECSLGMEMKVTFRNLA